MPITILAVGGLAHDLYEAAAKEYEKRLNRYDKIKVIEVAEVADPPDASPALIELVCRREAQRLLAHITPSQHVVALDSSGLQYDSLAFSRKLENWRGQGKPLVFVIGGSNGLDVSVLSRADEQLSMSLWTFPHQLARVVLLEQLYRAYKIIRHERYHK